ncbi:MAG TPA: response regulator [Myxococcota bacterium]|nr:response regulator [Myxococcota bacterium]HRY96255.1 response regulator [Myxococcota bacterium]HSA20453.1 response regulator [Myxococcota bacterium]
MGRKILLVDDTETVLLFMRMMLSTYGYDMTTAHDGREALAAVQADPPDLILLDIMMPVMDGIECCRRVKADPKTNRIPIVMVTTKGEPALVERAFLAGCNDYLTKPVSKLELLAKVRGFID